MQDATGSQSSCCSSSPGLDEYGHANLAEPKVVLEAFASVEQMSATKTMMTFQQANVVGLDIEMRWTDVKFNGIRWQGHDIVVSAGGKRGRAQPHASDIRILSD